VYGFEHSEFYNYFEDDTNGIFTCKIISRY
jgi:hypothetical protein